MGRYCLTCELGGCEPATSRPSEAAASATAALYAADFLALPLLRHPPTDPHDHGMAAAARGTQHFLRGPHLALGVGTLGRGVIDLASRLSHATHQRRFSRSSAQNVTLPHPGMTSARTHHAHARAHSRGLSKESESSLKGRA